LWMCRRLQDAVFERELLLLVLDHEIDLGTVREDNGFCSAQERSAQNDGCPFISTYFQNHKVYGNIWLSNSNDSIFINSLGGSRVIDLQAANVYLCTTRDLLNFFHRLPLAWYWHLLRKSQIASWKMWGCKVLDG
jgi:hypothetical protein